MSAPDLNSRMHAILRQVHNEKMTTFENHWELTLESMFLEEFEKAVRAGATAFVWPNFETMCDNPSSFFEKAGVQVIQGWWTPEFRAFVANKLQLHGLKTSDYEHEDEPGVYVLLVSNLNLDKDA